MYPKSRPHNLLSSLSETPLRRPLRGSPSCCPSCSPSRLGRSPDRCSPHCSDNYVPGRLARCCPDCPQSRLPGCSVRCSRSRSDHCGLSRCPHGSLSSSDRCFPDCSVNCLPSCFVHCCLGCRDGPDLGPARPLDRARGDTWPRRPLPDSACHLRNLWLVRTAFGVSRGRRCRRSEVARLPPDARRLRALVQFDAGYPSEMAVCGENQVAILDGNRCQNEVAERQG
jgi:hypothetical protein